MWPLAHQQVTAFDEATCKITQHLENAVVIASPPCNQHDCQLAASLTNRTRVG